ncbi:MAG: polyprenyl synthetase family protein [Clostridia bacterium]|nr:polyprenyl synthetase family protein [Clostridia bacterium]
MKTQYESYKGMVDTELHNRFGEVSDALPHAGILKAVGYSLLAGGKRVRPVLVLSFCRAAGGNAEKALPVACAVEMLHTYSLIHDDLPCMDNDDLRRGKPTNHKVFGETTAVLAGDALQAEAFGAILRSDLPAKTKSSCAEMLADAAGVDGICGGQYLDMLAEGKTISEDQLSEIHSRKTASMIIAACRMGARAGGASFRQMQAATLYGAAVGLAFQIRDDMLDVVGTDEKLGKPVGSDEREGKTTFMTLFGEEKCASMIDKLTAAAKNTVCQAFEDAEFLCWLAQELSGRNS